MTSRSWSLPFACLLGGTTALGACAAGSMGEELFVVGDKTAPQPEGSGPLDGSSGPKADASSDAAPAEVDATDAASPASSSTHVNGSVNGTSIVAKEAFAVVRTSFGGVEAVVAGIHERTGFCADYAAGIDRANDDQLLLVVRAAGVSSVAAGTYPIGKGTFEVEARLLAYDGSCKNTIGAANEWAKSGTITIASIGPSTVIGSFDVTFAGGAKLTGAFDAARCTQPGAASFACTP